MNTVNVTCKVDKTWNVAVDDFLLNAELNAIREISAIRVCDRINKFRPKTPVLM